MQIVALEEHFVTPDVQRAWAGPGAEAQGMDRLTGRGPDLPRRLADLGEERLAMMDDAGVDVQVLSLTAPGLHTLPAPEAVSLQREVNDLVAATVRSHPHRYQGFATLALPDPVSAAEELRRAVCDLGLQGAHVFGRTRERNFDHPDNWPIFEVASELRAPIYIHPQIPQPGVRAAYYEGLGDAALEQAFSTFGLGWHYETGIQFLRLALTGVLDRFPDLQLIVGHWGEVVLFYMERTESLFAAAGRERTLHEYARSQLSVTPAGIASHRYLRWCLDVLGPERIMFSTDYPFQIAPDLGSRRFLEEADIGPAEREAIASGNWARMVKGIRR
jgi:predicted TIM-barrel fold metal-dependent hydrolase